MEKERECPCSNVDCERRGDCVSCYNSHLPKPNPVYCKRSECAIPEELLAELQARVNGRLRAAGIQLFDD